MTGAECDPEFCAAPTPPIPFPIRRKAADTIPEYRPGDCSTPIVLDFVPSNMGRDRLATSVASIVSSSSSASTIGVGVIYVAIIVTSSSLEAALITVPISDAFESTSEADSELSSRRSRPPEGPPTAPTFPLDNAFNVRLSITGVLPLFCSSDASSMTVVVIVVVVVSNDGAIPLLPVGTIAVAFAVVAVCMLGVAVSDPDVDVDIDVDIEAGVGLVSIDFVPSMLSTPALLSSVASVASFVFSVFTSAVAVPT